MVTRSICTVSLLIFCFSCLITDRREVSAVSTESVNGENYEFQAEVGRLMDIIVHSLYSNRDVFLRELISNAADALDKIRMLSLTDSSQLSGNPGLDIRIRSSAESRTIDIIDSGIGMTREDLITNLGSIAKSGTSAFLDQLAQNAGDSGNLIGQFGVGFYSAFLVADVVTVTSKSNKSDKQWVWKSSAGASYSISEDDGGEALVRGTKISLHLKDDALDYLSTAKLEDLVMKYSQFVSFPIFLEVETEVSVKTTPEDDDSDTEDRRSHTSDSGSDDDEAAIVSDEKEEKVEEGKKELVKEWKHLNSMKPLWIRDASEVSDNEHIDFFRSLSRSTGKPLARIHFKAEGGVNFRSLLYISDHKPPGFANRAGDSNVKLFVRRVLVRDTFGGGLLPSYLNFISGVVDSDDLPINVSREMLQHSKILDLIKRKLLRKALEMIRNLMLEDTDTDVDKDESSSISDSTADTGNSDSDGGKYMRFWKTHGKNLKFGVLEDDQNRQRLAKLLRYRTSMCNLSEPEDYVSLDTYVDRMKDQQEYIYYHSGETVEQVKDSPFLEKLLELGYEVIYLTDAMDEHVFQYLGDYEGLKFMAVSKDNFKFAPDDHKAEKRKIKNAKAAFEPLKNFVMRNMPDKVAKVKLSARLTKSPLVLSAANYGYSAHMELIIRAQAFQDPENVKMMTPKEKTMEINPFHPLILKLLDLVLEDPESETAKHLLEYMYDAALVSSGYFIEHPKEVSGRFTDLLGSVSGVDLDVQVSEAQIEERVPEDYDEELDPEMEHPEFPDFGSPGFTMDDDAYLSRDEL